MAIAIGGFAYFAWRPLAEKFGFIPKTTDEQLARAVGDHYPVISDKLVNALQLARPLFSESASLHGSPAFAMAAFGSTYSSTRQVNFLDILDKRPRKRAAMYFAFASILSLGTLIGFENEMLAAGERLANYNTFYQKPAPFIFEVKPGDVRVLRGDTVDLVVTTQGEQLRRITLHTREEGQKEWTRLELESQVLLAGVGGDGKQQGFVYPLRANRSTEYFAESREIESERFDVRVMDRPMVRSLSVLVTPPSYTRERPTQLEENIGDLSGVRGTRGDFT
ncbi:MAG TPA: hypothetical protein VFH43_03995, partial [Candidatus Kapabacteria bacterium]|nr:hypothetical protein [Candidatus Kapabacteria bacterium]